MKDEVNTKEILSDLSRELLDAIDDSFKRYWLNEASKFLQDAGFEDASKALDCEFDL